MAVQHFDIDDQWNKNNIAEAQRMYEEEKAWKKQNGFRCGVWDARFNLPREDDEAVET